MSNLEEATTAAVWNEDTSSTNWRTPDLLSTMNATVGQSCSSRDGGSHAPFRFWCPDFVTTRAAFERNSLAKAYWQSTVGVDFILFAIGLALNLVCFALFQRCSFRRAPSTLLMAVGCLVDSAALIITSLLSALQRLYEGEQQALWTGNEACKAFSYADRVATSLTAALIALLGLERVLLFMARCCSCPGPLGRRGAIGLFICTTLALLGACLPAVFWRRWYCAEDLCAAPIAQARVLFLLDLSLQHLVPYACVLIFLLFLLVLSIGDCYAHVKSPIDQWATTLTAISQCTFLVSTLPIFVFDLLAFYNDTLYGLRSCSTGHYESEQTIRLALRTVARLHLAVKPFSYLICSRFRREIPVLQCSKQGLRPNLPRDSMMVNNKHHT